MCAAVVVSAQAQMSAKKKIKPQPKPAPVLLHVNNAYFAGHEVKFKSEASAKSAHVLAVGPWNLGEKVNPGNNDMRPNLYFVFPGAQHKADGRPDFDHNQVLSAVPKEESNFDVYWVVVLDPAAVQDFTSEQQIIVATQETFEPGDNFPFEQVPSAGFLRTFLKVDDMAGLEKFKRPDGDLPRVAIIPAKITVKATAEEIETPEQQQTSVASQK
jgi:hypothetical protein